MKDALAAAGLTEEEAKQEQQQHQKLTQQSKMRQGLFGLPMPFHKHSAPAAVESIPAAAATVSAASAAAPAAAAPAAGEGASPAATDPLAITHKAEFNVTTGGKLVGKVVVGLFGNMAPKTVQNVSKATVCLGASEIGRSGHHLLAGGVEMA
jgi:hypothetical protein